MFQIPSFISHKTCSFGSRYDERELKLKGTLGLNYLIKQELQKTFKNEYEFNVLCIGTPSIGKSTVLECLFNVNFDPSDTDVVNPILLSQTYVVRENDISVKLSIIKSVDFGAGLLNKQECCNLVVDYVDQQHNRYLREELKFKRSYQNLPDTRIHVCLYFISALRPRLTCLDLMCLKKLNRKANLVPVISMADALTQAELEEFRLHVMKELDNANVEVYSFPPQGECFKSPRPKLPFAVVSSRESNWVRGKQKLSRVYPWGIVEVENEAHNDLVKLREALVDNMVDFCDKTHDRYFGIFRTEALNKMGFNDYSDKGKQRVSLQQNLQIQYISYLERCERERESLQLKFNSQLKEAESRLDQFEDEIRAKYKKLEEDARREERMLEDRRRQLDRDVAEFKKLIGSSSSCHIKRRKSLQRIRLNY